MSLSNKVALVTGGSSGIGAAIAKLFSKEGAKVAIVGRNETNLKIVTEECAKLGVKPLGIIADVSKDPDAKRIVETTVSNFGQLDVLVNNAGFAGMAAIDDINAMQIFDQVMAINLRAVVHLTHLAAPHLVGRKGNIINISSVSAFITAPARNSAYCTSKAGMDHFSRCAAQELASKGVRCNTVNPGPVFTNIMANAGMNEAQQKALWDNFRKHAALKRISDPIEIADLVLFLASDKAKGITGASFVVDNGVLLSG